MTMSNMMSMFQGIGDVGVCTPKTCSGKDLGAMFKAGTRNSAMVSIMVSLNYGRLMFAMVIHNKIT